MIEPVMERWLRELPRWQTYNPYPVKIGCVPCNPKGSLGRVEPEEIRIDVTMWHAYINSYEVRNAHIQDDLAGAVREILLAACRRVGSRSGFSPARSP
jgi:hypothetical protein